jgi:hypothetical protein
MPLAREQPYCVDPSSRSPVAGDLAVEAGAVRESETGAVPGSGAHDVGAEPVPQCGSKPFFTDPTRVMRAASARAPTTGLVLLASVVTLCPVAKAVPSFTRQTGLVCTVCHSNPPELTAFGRKFKLDGYTLTDKKPDTTIGGKDLQLSRYFPIGGMLTLDETGTNTPVPQAQNWNANGSLTLYLAGEISSHVGGMIQASYSVSSGHFNWNNTDVRYANHTTLGSKDLLYGLTLNNSPTVEDVWNSTPAWGYPWFGGNAPVPSAQPIIAGALAQDVLGLGAYAMWNDHVYADFTLYRSEHLGGSQPLTGIGFPINIQGVAPYWRLAWQQTWGLNYLMVGTYGMYVSSTPDGVTGLRNSYADPSIDLQYERPFGVNLLTVHMTYIHEISNLTATFAAGGAAEALHRLNTFRTDATYHLRSRYTFTLSGFSTTGSGDPLLYAPAPVTGSLLGSPNSSGFIGQAGFWPQQNIELSASYTGYTKFNGASHNYDGSGRDASANNSLFIGLLLNF